MTTKTKNTAEQQTLEDSKKHLNTAAQRAYSDQKERLIDDEKISQFLPMVHKIVQKVVTYLKPPLSYEDLVSAGTLGLIKAARDYDPSYHTDFKTYAYIRTRGAILDELRDWSFVPAAVDKKIHKTLQISTEITEQTGSLPTDEQLTQKLGITIDSLYEIYNSARAKSFLSIDSSKENSTGLGDLLTSNRTATPDKCLEKAELIDKLTNAIQQLSEKQRQVILLYYHQQLTMKQIAEIFEITEPRVSQLHASALFHLSIKLRQWKDETK